MIRLAPLLSAVLLAGCMTPTWQSHTPGAPIAADRVILVGSFAAVPPINQEREGPAPRRYISGPVASQVGGGGPTVLIGKQEGNVMAFFTPDLTEKMKPGIGSFPFRTFDWAWIPMEGTFAIEVPRREKIFLRGMHYYTKGDDAAVRFELPGTVTLRPDDKVVYVGEIRLVRTGERSTTFIDRRADARQALEAAGQAELLALPWRTQILVP